MTGLKYYPLEDFPFGISKEEYIEGRVSVARNQIIADIFYRLKIIEKLATGIRRIREYYKNTMVKPAFHVSENSVLVVLPRINNEHKTEDVLHSDRASRLSEKEEIIYRLIENKGPIFRSEIENEIGLGKSQTIELINKLRSLQFITSVGQGRSTRYIITK